MGGLKHFLDVFGKTAKHQPAAGIMREAAQTEERTEADAGHESDVAEIDGDLAGARFIDGSQKLPADRRALLLVAQLPIQKGQNQDSLLHGDIDMLSRVSGHERHL